MKIWQPIRALVVAAAVLALLFSLTAAGEACEAWQHHNCASCDTCQLCHVGHQAIEAATQPNPLAAPEPLDFLSVFPVVSFVPAPSAPRFGTRAPPSSTLS
jgi:hypothetical protein